MYNLLHQKEAHTFPKLDLAQLTSQKDKQYKHANVATHTIHSDDGTRGRRIWRALRP